MFSPWGPVWRLSRPKSRQGPVRAGPARFRGGHDRRTSDFPRPESSVDQGRFLAGYRPTATRSQPPRVRPGVRHRQRGQLVVGDRRPLRAGCCGNRRRLAGQRSRRRRAGRTCFGIRIGQGHEVGHRELARAALATPAWAGKISSTSTSALPPPLRKSARRGRLRQAPPPHRRSGFPGPIPGRRRYSYRTRNVSGPIVNSASGSKGAELDAAAADHRAVQRRQVAQHQQSVFFGNLAVTAADQRDGSP